MLGKLLKYDLKSMLKSFVPLWLTLLVVSIFNTFVLKTPNNVVLGDDSLTAAISMMVYIALIVAVMALTVVLIIQRFYKGLLKDEGYLMFTLPVRTWQLVASKLLSATIVVCLSGLVAGLSVVVIAVPTIDMNWAYFWEELMKVLDKEAIQTTLITLGSALATAMETIARVYFALAVGHLAHKHRIGLAVVTYIVVGSLVSAICLQMTANGFGTGGFLMASFMVMAPNEISINQMLLQTIAVSLVQIVVYFVGTERILNKRLNLE